MHIGIDLGVNLLNSNMYSKLTPEVKDYFLNKAVDKFLEEAIYKDSPTSNPQLGMTYEQIIKKYNRIYTLIIEAPITLSAKPSITPIPEYVEGDLPIDLYHIEASSSLIPSDTAPTKYINVPNNLPNITDIYAFNQHPYSAGSRYPATMIVNNKFRIFDYNRFTISSVKLIYIKVPAKIGKPSSVDIDCDLPIAFHDEIIDRAVAQIVAIGNLPNYQQLLEELAKNK